MKMRFRFEVIVAIPEDEAQGFLTSYANKSFDFFRYLADNNAKIKSIKPKK